MTKYVLVYNGWSSRTYSSFKRYFKDIEWVKRCYAEPEFEGDVPTYTDNVEEAYKFDSRELAESTNKLWNMHLVVETIEI